MGVWRVAKLTIPKKHPPDRPQTIPKQAQYRHSTGPGNMDFSASRPLTPLGAISVQLILGNGHMINDDSTMRVHEANKNAR